MSLDETEYAKNLYWVYGLILDESVGFDSKDVIKRLGMLGVGCRPFFYPMHQQPVLRKLGLFHNLRFPISERMYQKGLYLPSGLALNYKKIDNQFSFRPWLLYFLNLVNLLF